jgi:hypothetical protein
VTEPLASDTASDVEQRQLAAWRALTPAEKASLITAASQAADRLALAGIHTRFPQASERECFLRLAVLKLGLAIAIRAYPAIAALQDVQ